MARDDSVLYSGASSGSFGTVKEQSIRTVKREEMLEKRSKLSPASVLIKNELQAEIDKLGQLNYDEIKLILGSGIPNALEIEMLSNAKTIEKLKSVQTRIANIMRENHK